MSGSATPTYSAGPTRANSASESAEATDASDAKLTKPVTSADAPTTSAIHIRARRSWSALRSIRHQVWREERDADGQPERPADASFVPLKRAEDPAARDRRQSHEVDRMLPAEHRVRRDRQGQEQSAAGDEGEPGGLGVTGPAEHRTGHPGGAGQRQQYAGSPGASYDEQRDAADDVRQADEREDDEDRVCDGGRHRPLPSATLAGPDDRGRPVGDLELGEDAGQVVADGLGRQEQLLGDRRGTPPVAPAGRGSRARAG